MKLIVFLAVALAAVSLAASGEQQRILRRVIKSTPTATNLSRVRVVTTRSSGSAERGAVAEISSKEAANFGLRSANETVQTPASHQQSATKTKQAHPPSAVPALAPAEPTTTAPSSTTTTTSAPSTTSTLATTTSTAANTIPKASDRQQAQQQGEVELLSSAPSSWQTMTAVEAPAAALIAAGTRPSLVSNDLSSSSSEDTSFISQGSGDFLRSSSTKGRFTSQSADETFSRLRQQSSRKTQQQQQQQQQQSQTFFYPQQQRAQSKTSNYQATKTHWYQPPSTTTTQRPAPIVQEQQQYEQQSEQYVEQQVEGAAPPGQAEPFAFDFKTQDQSGNGQYRKEEGDKNGVVRGSYGYWSDGIYRQVNYIADENGFRAQIQSNEPGMKKDAESPASVEVRS